MNSTDLKKLATQVRRSDQMKQPVASVMEEATHRLLQLRVQAKALDFARRWDMAIQESMLPK